MNLSLPTSRGRFGRFGYSHSYGMGDALPYYCSQPQCQVPGQNCGGCPITPGQSPVSTGPTGQWSGNASTSDPTYANIPIGGFVGDFQVQTLDSFLNTVLQAKESPFMANVLAKGADTVANQSADFLAQAQSYCAINGALPDCGQLGSLVAKYQALFQSWAKGQQASTYQSGDTGTLFAPTNTLTNTAPQYTPPPQVKPTNVLAPPSTPANPISGQQNVTAPADQSQNSAVSWLESNWVLVAAGVAAVVFLPQLMKGGR